MGRGKDDANKKKRASFGSWEISDRMRQREGITRYEWGKASADVTEGDIEMGGGRTSAP